MSKILYYSNYCDNCKKLLQDLAKSQEKGDIHFICIDKRIKKNNGKTYIVLENSQEILLPPQINRVPALLYLNSNNNKILYGDDITNTIKPQENAFTNKVEIIKNTEEPMAFAFGSGPSSVVSDSYSFWDQDPESLSAQGNGGLRQLYNYSTINQENKINTPVDDYSPDKIGEVTIEKLQQERNQSLKK